MEEDFNKIFKSAVNLVKLGCFGELNKRFLENKIKKILGIIEVFFFSDDFYFESHIDNETKSGFLATETNYENFISKKNLLLQNLEICKKEVIIFMQYICYLNIAQEKFDKELLIDLKPVNLLEYKNLLIKKLDYTFQKYKTRINKKGEKLRSIYFSHFSEIKNLIITKEKSILILFPELQLLKNIVILQNKPNLKIKQEIEKICKIGSKILFNEMEKGLENCLRDISQCKSWSIEEQLFLINCFYEILKESKLLFYIYFQNFSDMLISLYTSIHLSITSVYSEKNNNKLFIKKLTNICWNVFSMLDFLEESTLELITFSNQKIDNEKIRLFLVDIKIQKGFLSNKLFESFRNYLSKFNDVKKLNFLSFFGSETKLELFLKFVNFLPLKTMTNKKFYLTTIISSENKNLALEFLKINFEEKKKNIIEDFLTKNNLEKFFKYLN